MIYFITNGTHVKIGMTKDNGTLKTRIATLQIGCPEKIRVLLLAEGGYGLEKTIHNRFNEYNSSGEWFNFRRSIESRDDMIAVLKEHDVSVDEKNDVATIFNIGEMNNKPTSKKKISVDKKTNEQIRLEKKLEKQKREEEKRIEKKAQDDEAKRLLYDKRFLGDKRVESLCVFIRGQADINMWITKSICDEALSIGQEIHGMWRTTDVQEAIYYYLDKKEWWKTSADTEHKERVEAERKAALSRNKYFESKVNLSKQKKRPTWFNEFFKYEAMEYYDILDKDRVSFKIKARRNRWKTKRQ